VRIETLVDIIGRMQREGRARHEAAMS
jgi:hypothetical protein